MNYAVLGLAFGDEGKGTVVDALTRKVNSKLTVLYCGGPQASHHVVLPDGTFHGFSQWGSGTFTGAKTYISRHRMIEPYAMWNEAEELKTKGIDPWSVLTVDPDCLVITPWQWRMNRLREQARGANRHGSCGMGIGETRQDALNGLQFKFKNNWVYTNSTLSAIRQAKINEAAKEFGKEAANWLAQYSVLTVADAYKQISYDIKSLHLETESMDNVIYEGSQGILLDEKYGCAPHNTWSDVTAYNARILSGGGSNLHVIGVLPAHWTRHGAGPFPSEISHQSIQSNHNVHNEWQGELRHGRFDMTLAKYALKCERVDSIALTKMDYGDPHTAIGTELWGERNFISAFPQSVNRLEDSLQRPISIVSSGPTYLEKDFSAVFSNQVESMVESPEI